MKKYEYLEVVFPGYKAVADPGVEYNGMYFQCHIQYNDINIMT